MNPLGVLADFRIIAYLAVSGLQQTLISEVETHQGHKGTHISPVS